MRSLPYLLLAALVGLELPAAGQAEYILRTRFVTVQLGRPTTPPIPPLPATGTAQSPAPLPLDPGAPPPVPDGALTPPEPLPPADEQPLTPPRPVQGPLPAAPGAPALVAPAAPLPGPAVPALTPVEFVKAFQPLPGVHEVVLIHPYTGCPVPVRFCLPPIPPRRVHVNKHRIEFSYRGHRDVVIRFHHNGTVSVRG